MNDGNMQFAKKLIRLMQLIVEEETYDLPDLKTMQTFTPVILFTSVEVQTDFDYTDVATYVTAVNAEKDETNLTVDESGAASKDETNLTVNESGAANKDETSLTVDESGAARKDETSLTVDESGAANKDETSLTVDESGAARKDETSLTVDESGAANKDETSLTVDESGAARKDETSLTADESGAANKDETSLTVDESGAARKDETSLTVDESGAARKDETNFTVDESGAARKDETSLTVDESGAARKDETSLTVDESGAARKDETSFTVNESGAANKDETSLTVDESGAARKDETSLTVDESCVSKKDATNLTVNESGAASKDETSLTVDESAVSNKDQTNVIVDGSGVSNKDQTNVTVDESAVSNKDQTNVIVDGSGVSNNNEINMSVESVALNNVETNMAAEESAVSNKDATNMAAEESAVSNKDATNMAADGSAVSNKDATNMAADGSAASNKDATNLAAEESAVSNKYATNMAADGSAVSNKDATNMAADGSAVSNKDATNMAADGSAVSNKDATNMAAEESAVSNKDATNMAADGSAVSNKDATNMAADGSAASNNDEMNLSNGAAVVSEKNESSLHLKLVVSNGSVESVNTAEREPHLNVQVSEYNTTIHRNALEDRETQIITETIVHHSVVLKDLSRKDLEDVQSKKDTEVQKPSEIMDVSSQEATEDSQSTNLVESESTQNNSVSEKVTKRISSIEQVLMEDEAVDTSSERYVTKEVTDVISPITDGSDKESQENTAKSIIDIARTGESRKDANDDGEKCGEVQVLDDDDDNDEEDDDVIPDSQSSVVLSDDDEDDVTTKINGCPAVVEKIITTIVNSVKEISKPSSPEVTVISDDEGSVEYIEEILANNRPTKCKSENKVQPEGDNAEGNGDSTTNNTDDTSTKSICTATGIEKENPDTDLIQREMEIKRKLLISSSSEDESDSDTSSDISSISSDNENDISAMSNLKDENKVQTSSKDSVDNKEKPTDTKTDEHDDDTAQDKGETKNVTDVQDSEISTKKIEAKQETVDSHVDEAVENKNTKDEADSQDTETVQEKGDTKDETAEAEKKEDLEVKRLMDLSSLDKKKEAKLGETEAQEGSNDRAASDENQDVQEPNKKKKAPKEKEKSETLLDFLNESDSSDQSSDDSDKSKENMPADGKASQDFLEMHSRMLKQMVLESSDDDDDDENSHSSSSSTFDELLSKTHQEEKKKKQNKTEVGNVSNRTQQPSWMKDKLLHSEESELSSDEQRARWGKKRELEKKNRQRLIDTLKVEKNNSQESSDDFSDDCLILKTPKPVMPARVSTDASEEQKVVVSEDSTDSSSDNEPVHSNKTEDSPFKGRKNIKKILKKEALHVETRQALKIENERKKRVAERCKIEEELYPLPEGEGEATHLVLDFDRETKEPLVTVHKKLVKKLKPHQLKGIKFMWDNCFESLDRLEQDGGSGCILAHCMGLGKTLQVVALVHTLMSHDIGVKTVLIVCPLSTVKNWLYEFDFWLQTIHSSKVSLFDIIKYKAMYERARQLDCWKREGGVLVLSYDMYRNLITDKKARIKERDKEIFETALTDPGPDLVICDEGHLLKNSESALSRCMSMIKTSRRIVLTGTPLQNNLIEYHCMVQFIKPNILGNKREFMNRFVNPIQNGQFEDSTEADVRLMKRRSHVIHGILDGCIQRFDYSVLTPYLPAKHEYVISVILTESQSRAYKYYLDNFSAKSEITARSGTAKLFSDYQNLQRIWTHPLTLLAHKEKKKTSSKPRIEEDVEDDHSNDSVILVDKENDKERGRETWWMDFCKEEDYHDMRASGKLLLLFSILKECRAVGDKLLVFSPSLYALNLIEHFLCKINAATDRLPQLGGYLDEWVLGRDYFRLDGSTSTEQRSEWCRIFNKTDNQRARLFLISTRAGGLGINLVAANRVVVFSASWNPSLDVQSIFRVFRFGQIKPCYIYRFVSEGTMEEKIYERQVTKLSLARRVVDEHQIERHYTMRNLGELYNFEQTPKENRKTPIVPKDTLLANIMISHEDIIVSVHEHDSLLENKEEEELNEEERKAAWEDFEKEREERTQQLPQEPVSLIVPESLDFKKRWEFMKGVRPNDINREIDKYLNPLGVVGQPSGSHEVRRTHQFSLPQTDLNFRVQTGASNHSTTHELDPLVIDVDTDSSTTAPHPVIRRPPVQTVTLDEDTRRTPVIDPTQYRYSQSILQRGQKLGIVPYEGESVMSFYKRVTNLPLNTQRNVRR